MKFYPPRSPRDLVSRPRLRDRRVRGTTSKLMPVSAPVGFGKSTVLLNDLGALERGAVLVLDDYAAEGA